MPTILEPKKVSASKQGVKNAVSNTTRVTMWVTFAAAGLGLYAIVRPYLAQTPVVGRLWASSPGGAPLVDQFGTAMGGQ